MFVRQEHKWDELERIREGRTAGSEMSRNRNDPGVAESAV